MAAKRKNRKGRPLKPDMDRTKSGRISRARQPKEDVRAVAIDARERHTGLSRDVASHEKAGTILGRLWLRHKITTPMREAGERYLEWHAAMLKAIKAPDPLAKTSGKGADGELITEDYIKWAVRAVARYKVAKAWLDDVSLTAVVERVVIDDQVIDEAMLPYLVQGLKRLVEKMGIGAKVAA